jgi:hypothetical protein
MRRLIVLTVVVVIAFASPAAAKGSKGSDPKPLCRLAVSLTGYGTDIQRFNPDQVKELSTMAHQLGRARQIRPASSPATAMTNAQLSAALTASVTQTFAAQLQAVGNVATACVAAHIVTVPTTSTTTTTMPPGPIFTQSGTGISSTATFTVPSEWNLVWHYDCSGFSTGTGNFIVNITNSDGTDDIASAGVNQLGAGGDGTEHYHADPGSKFFKVNSECAWTISVVRA